VTDHSLSILVVEDDEALRTLFLALLTRQGFRVECVPDGAQALERLARTSYSAVLLDLMMAGTNGFDVLLQLAETQPSLLRKVIVTTGVSKRDLDKIDADGVFAVLRKPFDIDVLVTTIQACARQPARRRSVREAATGLDGSVLKFEAALPQLREMFLSDAGGDRELMLRHELRQVVGKLGGLFAAAASVESDAGRAQKYEELGRSASKLARHRQPPARHDH